MDDGSIDHPISVSLDRHKRLIERLVKGMMRKASRERDRYQRERDEWKSNAEGWVKWASTSRCIYCDEVFHHSAQDQIEADPDKKSHVLVCKNHPMRAVEAERDRLRALLRDARIYVDDVVYTKYGEKCERAPATTDLLARIDTMLDGEGEGVADTASKAASGGEPMRARAETFRLDLEARAAPSPTPTEVERALVMGQDAEKGQPVFIGGDGAVYTDENWWTGEPAKRPAPSPTPTEVGRAREWSHGCDALLMAIHLWYPAAKACPHCGRPFHESLVEPAAEAKEGGE